MKEAEEAADKAVRGTSAYLLNTAIARPDTGKMFLTGRARDGIEKPHNGSLNPTCIKTGAQRACEYCVMVTAWAWGSWGRRPERYIPPGAAKRSLDCW